jgi:hypothetical protein
MARPVRRTGNRGFAAAETAGQDKSMSDPKQRQDHPLDPDEIVDEASDESFPASDPPSWSTGQREKSGFGKPDPEHSDRSSEPDPRR